MGFFGLLWLKDDISKLETLLGITTNEEEKKILTEVIEDLKKQAKKGK